MNAVLQILRDMDEACFQKVFAVSPKKLREEIFRLAKIKVRGGTFVLKSSGKNEQRIRKLYQAVQTGFNLESQYCEELIRNYLFTRRALLGDALDQFNIPHEDGLTDSELDFFGELSAEEKDKLRSKLAETHDKADVDLYIQFMALNPSES